MQKSDADWKKILTPEQYHILREKGTEIPFTGKFLNATESGDYVCGACGTKLFSSDSKYESTIPSLMGWPSFSDIAHSDAVALLQDNSYGMQRVEVVCKNCGGHLGHLFEDDSSPTGQHYCISSAALNFKPKDKND